MIRWCCMLMLLAGCGAGDGGDGNPDAMGDRCEMMISYSPANPEVGDTIDLDGSIYKDGVSGLESYMFTVSAPGGGVSLTDRDPFDGSRKSFVPTEAGIHEVELRGEVGVRSCTDSLISINVLTPGALKKRYRFRFIPALGQSAPIQERTYEIPGGAAYDLQTINLDSGVAVSGVVRDDSASPIAAYLRFTLVGGDGTPIETFSDQNGDYAVRLSSAAYDVMVVPSDDTQAGALFTNRLAGTLNDLTLPLSGTISGTVADGGGQPIAGAVVSLRVGGVPSSLATTDGAGAFTVQSITGAATEVSVTPPAGSGLPRLELGAGAGLTATNGVDLAIRYSPALTSRALSFGARDVDTTTPLAGASVTLIMDALASAGFVTPQGGSAIAASGQHRVTAIASGAGVVSGLTVPQHTYQAILRPATGGLVTVADVDLSAGQATPATLSLAQPASILGRTLFGTQGQPGILIAAAPRGLLASEAGAAGMTTSSADGGFTVPVVGGGLYDLTIESSASSYARVRVTGVQAPAGGEMTTVLDVPLEAAIAVRGRVGLPGINGAPGITVLVLCDGCSGLAATTPVAEDVTDNGGYFEVAIPDPQNEASP